MNKILKIAAAATTVAMLALSSAPVLAVDSNSDSSAPSSSASTEIRQAALDAAKAKEQARVAAAKAEEQAKVAAAKEKLCATRKTTAGNIEDRISTRGQNRLNVITTVAGRVENYYVTKGLSVSNYDALVSDINAQKGTAQAAVDLVKADAAQMSSVTCGDGSGRTAVEKFKTDLKAEQAALKAYNTSVKNLITAVRAAKTTTGGAQQ